MTTTKLNLHLNQSVKTRSDFTTLEHFLAGNTKWFNDKTGSVLAISGDEILVKFDDKELGRRWILRNWLIPQES